MGGQLFHLLLSWKVINILLQNFLDHSYKLSCVTCWNKGRGLEDSHSVFAFYLNIFLEFVKFEISSELQQELGNQMTKTP